METRPGRNGGRLKVIKKGDPGQNPAGRPKGSPNLSTVLKAMLEEKIDVRMDNGKIEKKKFMDVVIRKLIKKASDGDVRAIQEIFDRIDGKSKQPIEQLSDVTVTIKHES